jgi:hypothetical protein
MVIDAMQSQERFSIDDLKIFLDDLLEKMMSSSENSKKLEENAGPHPVRMTENSVTPEDIGLPTGIQPDEVGKLDQVKPDPEKVKTKS